jgi:hypothetical protein
LAAIKSRIRSGLPEQVFFCMTSRAEFSATFGRPSEVSFNAEDLFYIVSPHSDYLDGPFFLVNLVDKPVVEIDPS